MFLGILSPGSAFKRSFAMVLCRVASSRRIGSFVAPRSLASSVDMECRAARNSANGRAIARRSSSVSFAALMVLPSMSG